MYEMEWNVGIYRIFLVKLVVGWSNNRYKIILTVWLNFCSNLAIRSSYNRWKHFVAVGSSQHWFSTIGSQIWPLDVFTNTWVKSGSSDRQKFKSGHRIKFQNFQKRSQKNHPFFLKKKKSMIFRQFFEILFRLLHASLHSRFYHWFIYLELIYRRYLSDFLDIFLIFLLFDNQCSILFRGHPISNILMKSSIKTDFSIHDSTTSLLSINTPMFESQGTHCDGDAFIPTINYRQSKYLIIQAYRSTYTTWIPEKCCGTLQGAYYSYF